MKRFADFANEGKKDDNKKEWFGMSSDPDKEEQRNNGYYPEPDYYDDIGDNDYDEMGNDDYDDYDDDYYNSDYGGNYSSANFGFDREDINFLRGRTPLDLLKIDRNANYDKGDEIVYLGQSHGHKEQEGVVVRTRDDKKVVIKFKNGGKPLAADKYRLCKKDNYEKAKEEASKIIQKNKKDEEERKETARIEREKREKEAASRPKAEKGKPSEKWWEKNRKE